MPECVGPLGELLVSQRAIGLDRTKHMPAWTAAKLQQAIGGIPPVKETLPPEPRW